MGGLTTATIMGGRDNFQTPKIGTKNLRALCDGGSFIREGIQHVIDLANMIWNAFIWLGVLRVPWNK